MLIKDARYNTDDNYMQSKRHHTTKLHALCTAYSQTEQQYKTTDHQIKIYRYRCFHSYLVHSPPT